MSNDFNARYRLLKCVAVENGLRTHNAQELATGRVVMVHIADAAGPEDVERLGRQLDALREPDKNKVLERATLASGFAIVTEFLPGFSSFPSWLAAHRLSQAESPSPSAPGAASADSPEGEVIPEPGSFTRMFDPVFARARAKAPVPPAPAPPASAPPASAPPASAPPASAPPASAPPAPTPQSSVQTPPLPPTPVPPTHESPARHEPGEFTRLFAPLSKAAPLPESPPPSRVSGPNTPAMPISQARAPSPPPPAPPVVPLHAHPFPVPPAPPVAAPVASPPLPPPVIPFEPNPPESREVPSNTPGILPPPIFRDPVTPLSPIGGASVRGNPSSPGPGDFTRIITQAPRPSVPVSKPAEAPRSGGAADNPKSPGGQRRRIPTGLVVGINAVVLVAIGLIMFALLRRPLPPVPVAPAVKVPVAPPTAVPR